MCNAVCLFGRRCVWGVKYVILLPISIGSRMVKGKQLKCIGTRWLVISEVWCQLSTRWCCWEEGCLIYLLTRGDKETSEKGLWKWCIHWIRSFHFAFRTPMCIYARILLKKCWLLKCLWCVALRSIEQGE